ncbi:MAG: hypothetical protein A2583_02615 [Bdellovibrionales bacterium RIFOXYD1_FULL_53_11]|nr:MAG: hypothetical protein A2583_02615 [Bdellovibrionales bacterium RIFOXYD1_FULL_53_11]
MIQSRPADGSKNAYDLQIQRLISTGNFTDSEQMIHDKITQNPDNPDGHYLLGVWHYFQGRLGKAVECMRKSLELDPRHTDAAICLSVLLNDIGKYDDARKIFEQANQSVAHRNPTTDSEVDRKFAVKHLELADLYFRYRRYDEAIEEYGRAAALDPSALDTRIRRAKAMSKKGFVTRALQELQLLKQEHSRYLPARIQLGLLHYSQGNLLDAELEWEGVLELNPSNREARSYMEMVRRDRLQPRR